MRYPASETAKKHKRIIRQATRLFRERGFSGVSVAEIMQATGLTHGPFYNHFPSKEDLMARSLEQGMQSTLAGIEQVGDSAKQTAEYLDRYLSPPIETLRGKDALWRPSLPSSHATMLYLAVGNKSAIPRVRSE